MHDPRAGAVVTFSGVTRDVDFLDYEAYAEMAAPPDRRRSSPRRSSATASARPPPSTASAASPRTEASVIVAASAPHRGEAFAGAREIIDEIKARAPIWKREEGEWKHGTHPPTLPPGPPASTAP